MIFLGKYEEFSPGTGFPSIRDYIQSEPYEHQSAIVNYLSSGHVHMVTAALFNDIFTGEQVRRSLVFMDDGKYSWTSRLPYYVEKYNLRLPEDFVAHVLGKLFSDDNA